MIYIIVGVINYNTSIIHETMTKLFSKNLVIYGQSQWQEIIKIWEYKNVYEMLCK